MSVTGHHSLNSLAIYEKVSTNEKITMGMCMNYYLSTDNLTSTFEQPTLHQRKGPRPILPKQSTTESVSAPLQDTTNTSPAVTLPSEINIPIPENQHESHKLDENSLQLVALPMEEEDPLAENMDLPMDFDVMKYVAEIQNEENTMISTQKQDGKEVTTTTSYQKTIKKSPNMPIFQNCKISSITINIQK